MVDRIVLDYTARIPPSALHDRGVLGVCRYLAPASDRWKIITLAEYRELEMNAIQVTLNWEHDARDWLTGTSGGKSHGEMAVFQARQLGYPKGRVIVGSCDFDIVRGQWDMAGRAYAIAFAKAIRAGGYRPGVYGPWDVLTWVRDEGIMDAFWQAGMSTAWSQGRNRNRWPDAHIRQRSQFTLSGVQVDLNEILQLPLWGEEEGSDMSQKDVDDITNLLAAGYSTAGYADQDENPINDILSQYNLKALSEKLDTVLERLDTHAPVATQEQVNVAVGAWLDQHVHLS